jgi:4-aminobutyrate aminotransferase-like enzyme
MTAVAAAPYWAHVDLNEVPHIKVPPPGPRSKELHARCTKYFKGLSGQVKLFPVAFESGRGCELVVPDVVAIGKGFGNGFPVTCVAVREPFKESFEKISASSSYGGNPMACAAALASTEVIEEENLLERSAHLGELALKRMKRMLSEHEIVGDVRAKGFLMGIELVKDKKTKEPLNKAGEMVDQKAFAKGLAWIPAGHILRMSPPVVMEDECLLKGLDIIDEAIDESQRELGY